MGERKGRLVREKSRSKGNYTGGKSWKRLVLEVSKRKPLGEINKEGAGVEKGKRKMEETVN